MSPRGWPSLGVQGTHPQHLSGFFQPSYPLFCHPLKIPSSFCPISRFCLPIPCEPQDWTNPGVVGESTWHRLRERKTRPWQQFVTRIHCSSWWQQSPKNKGRAAGSVCSRDLFLGLTKAENPTGPAVSPGCHCDKNHRNGVWEGGSDPPVV